MSAKKFNAKKFENEVSTLPTKILLRELEISTERRTNRIVRSILKDRGLTDRQIRQRRST